MKLTLPHINEIWESNIFPYQFFQFIDLNTYFKYKYHKELFGYRKLASIYTLINDYRLKRKII